MHWLKESQGGKPDFGRGGSSRRKRLTLGNLRRTNMNEGWLFLTHKTALHQVGLIDY